MFTDKLFTGQREMTGLGIYHYGARFYSPKLGRFISADSIVPNSANPQDFNRYSYVQNNPVNFIDPSGHINCKSGYDPDCYDRDRKGELIAKPTKNYNGGDGGGGTQTPT